MIEKIFIPTVKRINNQITYNNLPNSLKKIVTFVVQYWERKEYNYDCEYLVLPNKDKYHYSNYYCISNTRKFIYEYASNMKYAILDDDIEFQRRNLKYFNKDSNMEKSKRKCTDEDIIEMFNMFDNWLNLKNISVCGCSLIENPPSKNIYNDNKSISSAFWIDGKKIKNILSKLDLTSVGISEDICFILNLLCHGYGTRASNEFVLSNISASKKNMKSLIWDNIKKEQVLKDQIHLSKLFPNIYNILYDKNDNMMQTGYRNINKTRIMWSKAYNIFNINKKKTTLEKFLV
jgi:hypothetical protein